MFLAALTAGENSSEWKLPLLVLGKKAVETERTSVCWVDVLVVVFACW